jgi:hypothetical protein
LERQRETELQGLTLEQLAADEVSPLKAGIQALAERKYVLESTSIKVDLGNYDLERAVFPIALNASHEVEGAAKPKSKFSFSGLWKNAAQSASNDLAGASIKLAVNGKLPLAPDEARQFKQHWTSGLVRAEVTVTPMSGVKTVQLINDGDGSRRRQFGDEFMTEEERKERQERPERQERQERQYRPAMRVIPSGGFEIAETEVTQAQWRAVMGNNPSHYSSCGDDCPVERVSWDDVQGYLSKLNQLSGKQYRLPTVQEWIHACDGGSSHEFCGSDSLDAVGWYRSNSGGKTHPVGQRQANGYGLYDMSGNVWEWMQGCNVGYCTERFRRVGSWGDIPGAARSAHYLSLTPDFRLNDLGFRLARGARAH